MLFFYIYVMLISPIVRILGTLALLSLTTSVAIAAAVSDCTLVHPTFFGIAVLLGLIAGLIAGLIVLLGVIMQYIYAYRQAQEDKKHIEYHAHRFGDSD